MKFFFVYKYSDLSIIRTAFALPCLIFISLSVKFHMRYFTFFYFILFRIRIHQCSSTLSASPPAFIARFSFLVLRKQERDRKNGKEYNTKKYSRKINSSKEEILISSLSDYTFDVATN